MKNLKQQRQDMKHWLQARKEESLYRQVKISDSPQSVYMVIDGREVLTFCSNNYLGLANHPEIIKAFKTAADRYGVGSGSAHLINGHTRVHQELEEKLAEFTGRDRALVFSSGFAANLSVLDTFTDKQSDVYQDRLNHASLLDGARLSGARLRRYQHNDMQHLQRLLTKSKQDVSSRMIAADGVFSMDGDQADVVQLSELAKQHQAWLYIDDAHGVGVAGKGQGTVAELGLDQSDVPLLMATCGKALGTAGAFVAGDDTFIDYLLQKSRPWIFTTAMPPAIAGATIASLDLIKRESWRQDKLLELTNYMKAQLAQLNFTVMPSNSAIQPIMIGNEKKAMDMSNNLLKQGILISAIRYPTVPKGQARLRITLNADHRLTDIDKLINILSGL